MYSSLLVPTDGSPLSERAVPLAAEIARRTGATVHLVSVFDPTIYIPLSPTEARGAVFDASSVQVQHEDNLGRLNAQVAELRAQGIAAEAHAADGTVVEALVEQASATGADCIVMATHGRSGFARARLGSVASAVLARSGVPVLLVSAAAEATPAIMQGPVMCALDGEPFAEAMLPHATRFASALGLPVALLAVAAPHRVPMAPVGIEALAEPVDDEATAATRRYLERVAERCPAGTVARVAKSFDVEAAILAEADLLDAAVVAMSTHARGGISRFFNPSVTDAVVHRCARPVLVYHPAAEESDGASTRSSAAAPEADATK